MRVVHTVEPIDIFLYAILARWTRWRGPRNRVGVFGDKPPFAVSVKLDDPLTEEPARSLSRTTSFYVYAED